MAEYDAIAQSYSEIIEGLPERRLFGYSLEVVEGDVAGLDVLDLACGTGAFTRNLKKRGARRVVGVDVSEGMLDFARKQEAAAPLGVEYITEDVASLPRVGEFDLVTAFALLHYAPSSDALLAMMRSVHDNLRPGGRFTASNMNVVSPEDWVDAKRWSDRALRFAPFNGPLYDGLVVPSSLNWNQVSIPMELYYYSRHTYEDGLRAAGFRHIRWHRPVLPPEFEAERPHWQLYLDNPPILVLECHRS
ncbi:class I SAM-dependent methyltransferase [Actinokineospora sp. HUAS TT18]|uniref:class I SAM-dependent methyltransferase n=1 Tax=Actinokineospora sp. HUAS TT18 TaxID=3447451 RepID=UPI003F51E075